MRGSNILVNNVVINQLQREILLSIKGLCMKESNTLADNVVISLLQREILQSIKELCMKESNNSKENKLRNWKKLPKLNTM